MAIVGATVPLLTGSGVAIAAGEDDANETPITGAALVRAEQAALAETGGGRLSATEVEYEED